MEDPKYRIFIFFCVSQYLREWGKSEKKINLRLLFLRIKKFLIEKKKIEFLCI